MSQMTGGNSIPSDCSHNPYKNGRHYERKRSKLLARPTENLPQKIMIFIDSNGMATITDLFTDALPIALSLNPNDKRIRKFLSSQIRSSAETCPRQKKSSAETCHRIKT